MIDLAELLLFFIVVVIALPSLLSFEERRNAKLRNTGSDRE